VAESEKIKFINLYVETPLSTAAIDMQHLVADGVNISELVVDEATNTVFLKLPVVTESEVYFLETYKKSIRSNNRIFQRENEEATIAYRSK